MLIAFLAIVALTGGASRDDVQSLIILRPAAALFLGFAFVGLTRDEAVGVRALFVMALAVVALAILHLVPLPWSIWTQLPGRDMIAAVDRANGLAGQWRPLNLTPDQGWNALFSLIVPVACLALAARITFRDHLSVLALVLALGGFSAVLGLLQMLGPNESPLYLYRVTNEGAAVGLFSNRNHQAIFLATLFPMLAVYASTNLRSEDAMKRRRIVAAGCGAVLIPMLLATGSRGGLLLGTIGLATVPLLLKSPQNLSPAKRGKKKKSIAAIVAVSATASLAIATIVFGRAEAFDRILRTSRFDELRAGLWSVTSDLVAHYFPFGSGFGGFAPIYQIAEPDSLLEAIYMNHAHNDWLEVAMTGGVPAIILCLLAILWWGKQAWRWFRIETNRTSHVILARLGVIIMAMLGIASLADYPLRTPLLACLFVIAAIWTCGNRRQGLRPDSAKPLDYSPRLL